ncbi:MAG: carboxylesterase family protein [Pseudomonadales bacterium]|nr:carboxylesterase family protein [Pseudomonadales bacterium]NIX07284.1 carboxylesterase family protein [Pseudomonadales bacterium]
MKRAAIILIVLSGLVLAVFAWFPAETLRDAARALDRTPPEPAPRNDVTRRPTESGDVVGFIGEHGARTWRGVPYARPPVGALRWRAPQPAEPWPGVREATAPGPLCAQRAGVLSGDGFAPTRVAAGSEDCLYLDVYAPANAHRLPVMFWIHGGGNSVGHNGPYDGARLATWRDVVVVTVNYRLAHLGWFAHPALATGNALHDSGNYGTLDLIRALHWVRDNIESFGGDPANVTVFGESAGGTNTLSIVASRLAAGLFHRAIVQSGGMTLMPMDRARGYAEDGGHANSAREIVNRLLIADGLASTPADAQRVQAGMPEGALRDYLYTKTVTELFAVFDAGFAGMIDTPEIFGDGHVLPAAPALEVFADASRHNAVPVILGSNRDEPALFMVANPEHVDTYLWVFRRLKDEAGYRREVSYLSRGWKARGVDDIAEAMTAAGNPHVYAYRFDWDEEPTIFGFDLSVALGAAHALELPFVFGSFTGGLGLSYLYHESEGRHALAESITSYWTEFAYRGDPGTGRDEGEVRWHPWGSGGATSIVLDTLEDQGIYMSTERVTTAAVKNAIAADPGIPDQRERCLLYYRAFAWGPQFDAEEFARFADGGCAAYDPKDLAAF